MKKLTTKYKKYKPYIYAISKEAFQIVLFTYLALLLFETIKPGFVSFFLEINYILIPLLISGIIMVLTEVEGSKLKSSQVTNKIWHQTFYNLSAKSKYAKNYPLLFKEIRAKEIINRGWQMTYKDWRLYSKEQEFIQGLFDSTRIKHLSMAREREWNAFLATATSKKISSKDLQFILLISIAGTGLIFYKTQTLGIISIFISILTGIIILLLSILIYSED